MRRPQLLILAAALIITLPLILDGPSCGHDITFHLQSWLEASTQLRHGTFPHWAFSPAWNAGEPRFIFYPPISWLLGALLTLAFPIPYVPAIYTFFALAAAGLAMHRLATHFAPGTPALIASVLYILNPYMLFTAYERTAYAELLSAAWLPLLFLAILRRKPTAHGIAFPLAVLWLTNAPAAVMGSYTLALVITVRLLFTLKAPREAFTLARSAIAGTALGLTLPAFYLVSAAYERRFVQISMAVIPNMRIEDNFLFTHTADAPHNAVLHTASLIAITLLFITAATLLLLLTKAPTHTLPSRPERAAGSGETRFPVAPLLATLTTAIALLLTRISTPLWHHLPNLAFLQFPWRLLAILSVTLALALALLLCNIRIAPTKTTILLLTITTIATATGIHQLRQPCELADQPQTRAQLFLTHHGAPPTDEYTPTTADNDHLRADDPAFWLALTPDAFAPNTTPNPAATDPTYDSSDTPANTLSTPAPQHATLHAATPGFLILNLRDYPNWNITLTDPNSLNTLHPPHIPRDDGLIALAIPHPGDYTLHIAWRYTVDQKLGIILSFLALCAYSYIAFKPSRRIEV